MYMPFHRMKCTYTQFSLGLHFYTYTFDKFNHEIFWNISPAISKWKILSFKIHKGATFDAHLSGKQHYWEFFLSNLPAHCPETDTGICSIVFSEPARDYKNHHKGFSFLEEDCFWSWKSVSSGENIKNIKINLTNSKWKNNQLCQRLHCGGTNKFASPNKWPGGRPIMDTIYENRFAI